MAKYTANQLYNYYHMNSGTTIKFTDWLTQEKALYAAAKNKKELSFEDWEANKLRKSGILQGLLNIFETAKETQSTISGDPVTTTTDYEYNNQEDKPQMKIMGMPIYVAVPVITVALVGVGFGIYKLVKIINKK